MNLADIILATIMSALLYSVVHELIHYVTALMLGYNARLYIASDGILPSPAVEIKNEPQGVNKAIILYSPYIFNLIVLVTVNTVPLRLIALLTLPNILLEERRSILRTTIVAIGISMLILFIGKNGIGMSY
ncbi:hypothetical protein Pyrde_1098 [Pyrodictium delaneyi]|uniref:Peptidase M50 domain-containing protein n=1 Tax=Pyrodictium delaneyi TaxID=1273541 RepID=A0A0P0N411_9CREN|nr:hypothetical protein [Pyrodictium delaneyi]ALL01146.1 hypothetical protein Pyrde_1098 [Pyrodictium delaneyi]OWJ55278.1 hypothetical protein Pdsh_00145 [Pyrodictium delaneyi]